MEYIVAVEYRVKGEKRAVKDFRECETLEDAKELADLWVKMYKDNCELFDVRIYELTNY